MPDRTTMNVSLPTSMRRWLVEQVSEGGYGTVSEYVRELVRDAQQEKSRRDTEQMLLESLASPSSEMTEADWKALRRRARQAGAAAKKRTRR